MIPQINNCLVCEIVREELHNKLTVLGMFGVCPDVEVRLARLDQPAILTFLFTGTPGEGSLHVSFQVVDEANDRVLASTPDMPFNARPDSNTLLATTLVLLFGHSGDFAARLVIDGEEAHRGRFAVTEGVPAIARA